MLQNILPEEIKIHLEAREWKEVAKLHDKWPDPEIAAPELADFIEELDKADRVLCFRALPREVATELLSELDSETSDKLLLELTDQETRHLLENLNPDDMTWLLGELPGQVTQRLMTLLDPEDLKQARKLLGYPEESVGRLMTPDYITVKADWTIEKALRHIRKVGHESETINVIYVIDNKGKLQDALPVQRFILSDPSLQIREIMDYFYVSLSAYEDREEAVRTMQRYDRVALPVVDSQNVLLGIVTFDDVFEVAEEEATEDFHKSAAVSPLKVSYWDAKPWVLFRSRIGWLMGLVVVNLLSSGVIAAYEETLAAYVALAFFIPLIIDTGGNAGSQSATLMIRSISTGDVKMGQWLGAFLKEIVIGLCIGLTLGLMGLALGIFRGGFQVGLVVLLTMVVMLLITNLIGVVLPFILTKLKLDPAIASGPLITSVADAVGLIIYFSIAGLILGL